MDSLDPSREPVGDAGRVSEAAQAVVRAYESGLLLPIGDAQTIDDLKAALKAESSTPAEASEAEQSFQETPGMFDVTPYLHPPTIDPPYTPEGTP